MNPDIRLLIVDDNVATRYSVRRVLEHNGCRVDEAGTGPGSFIVIDPDGNPVLLDQHR